MVLRHYHGDPLIDTKNVEVSPAIQGVEGVHETIALPGLPAVPIVEIQEAVEGVVGQKRDLTSGSAGDDRAVNMPNLRWSSPRLIAEPGVRRGDAPGVGIVVREAPA